MRPETRLRSARDGFSLIELLVAATLGLLLLAGIGTVFLSTSRNARENDLVAGMQDQARFALSTLARDLAMAGYWGGLLGSGSIEPNLTDSSSLNDSTSATSALTPARDCGPSGTAWSFALQQPLEFRNHTRSDTPWPCLGHQRPGTDAFAIRRVSGQATGEMVLGDTDVLLRPYQLYLQTNATQGKLIRWPAAARAAPPDGSPPLHFNRYLPRIYFVRDFSLAPGDGIPTLCRKELCPSGYAAASDPELASCNESSGTAGAIGWYSECIAEGVEDLQILWGLDAVSGDDDFTVTRYTAAPSATELATQARSAQIHLLVRSRRGNPQYLDSKTYQLADKSAFTPTAVADAAGTPAEQQTRHFYRRAFSTTVQLRNLAIQGGSGAQ